MKKLLYIISTAALCALLSMPLNIHTHSIHKKEYIGKNLYCVTEIKKFILLIKQSYNAKQITVKPQAKL